MVAIGHGLLPTCLLNSEPVSPRKVIANTVDDLDETPKNYFIVLLCFIILFLYERNYTYSLIFVWIPR